ncbi:MAG: glycosyltransferase family 4 protein [Anaerolineae bacterium]|nr:glycosyltransferase family 4 protein [Anaerolineae bacterium]
MLIGIDASRATVKQRTGTEGYSLHIIRGLVEQGSGHRFRLYFRDTPEDDLVPEQDNIEKRVIIKARMWTHRGLGPDVRRDPPDVLFVPAHVIPWPAPADVPAVFTAHDLGYMHYPSKHPLFSRLYLDWSTRHSAAAARRVIADSKATAHDLIALIHTPPEKIRVVHPGVDDLLQPVEDKEKIDDLRKRLEISGPYILHVGSIQPRKNLTRLVEAFAQLVDEIEGLSLVLAGRLGWGYRSLFDRIQKLGLSDRVIVPGYVADEDLSTLYSGAEVYAFPSLYEGFGFPALEAMACKTPVVCANTSSLPELVQDAALTFAPTDVGALVNVLRKVLTEPSVKEKLIEYGYERVKRFSWESSARAILKILEEAAENYRNADYS